MKDWYYVALTTGQFEIRQGSHVVVGVVYEEEWAKEIINTKRDFKAHKETAEEIHQAFINKHNEWFKLYEENQQLNNECQSLIAFNNSLKEENQRLKYDNGIANSAIGELKEEKQFLLRVLKEVAETKFHWAGEIARRALEGAE